MQMDYRIKEVIKIMRLLEASSRKMKLAKLDHHAVANGLSLSKTTCEQEEFVFATPWMKNLLVSCGDVKQTYDKETGQWKTEKLKAGQDSKAVNLVNKWVEAALVKYNGPKRDHYDESKPVGDIDHYNTDCWLGWKPKIWDIQPGQAEERADVFRQYTKSDTGITTEQLISIITKDTAMQKAILNALSSLPEVRASREVTAISDPFMSKGTGVSYPYYRNDRTVVPDTQETYGKWIISQVQNVFDRKGIDGLTEMAYNNNVYTGYPRNQKGKGRALEAQSRITNLIVNMLNGPEMEEWKQSPILQTPFMDEDGIKQHLVEMAEWIEGHPEYVARNEDTSGWDRSVSTGWITLSGAIRYLKSNGNLSKRLCELRHNCAKRAWLIDGPNNKVSEMYGRTPSGYDDTTLLNSSVHFVLSDYALMKNDPTYSSSVIYPMRGKNKFIVGDDIDCVMKKGKASMDAFRKTYKQMGFTIHEDEKSIFGVMFIQYRVFRDPRDQHWVMAYNWPRVLRSTLSKETAKQLGEGGWTLSVYQQLGKLSQWDESCLIVLNILAACDQYKLHLDTPISKIKEMVLQEDENRINGKDTGSRRTGKLNRKLTTAERLSNNPTLPGVIEKDGKVEIDWDYFGELQKQFRRLYNPNFLPELGFENPDLSNVH